MIVVEDDHDSRAVFRRLISAQGAEVCEAALADPALELIPTFRPHVIVSDLGMPHRDGFSFIREVRARGYSPENLPAIALTAFARSEDSQRALHAGFQRHLTKPVDPTDLIDAIATAAGRHVAE